MSVGGLIDGWLPEADLVLTEGFRRAGLPVIRVHREAAKDPTWSAPSEPIAWVSDVPIDTAVPVLSLDDPGSVADFVLARLLPEEGVSRPATLVLPVGPRGDSAKLAQTARRLGSACDGVLVVRAPGASAPDGIPHVSDIRPGLGPLGGLLTALAAVDTPDVVYLGARYWDVGPEVVRMLREEGSPRADVVAPVDGALVEPTLARYGHRCLGAIKASLLSGEARMDSWWGQVRVSRLSREIWGPMVGNPTN